MVPKEKKEIFQETQRFKSLNSTIPLVFKIVVKIYTGKKKNGGGHLKCIMAKLKLPRMAEVEI